MTVFELVFDMVFNLFLSKTELKTKKHHKLCHLLNLTQQKILTD